jgi:hypothetical protein
LAGRAIEEKRADGGGSFGHGYRVQRSVFRHQSSAFSFDSEIAAGMEKMPPRGELGAEAPFFSRA